jgi:hypothetical protein
VQTLEDLVVMTEIVQSHNNEMAEALTPERAPGSAHKEMQGRTGVRLACRNKPASGALRKQAYNIR